MTRTFTWLYKWAGPAHMFPPKLVESEIAKNVRSILAVSRREDARSPVQVRLNIQGQECLFDIWPYHSIDWPSVATQSENANVIVLRHDEAFAEEKTDSHFFPATSIQNIIRNICFSPQHVDEGRINLYNSLLLPQKQNVFERLLSFLDPRFNRTQWALFHHGQIPPLLRSPQPEIPAFVFAGPPGTGKTALASTIGAPLASKLGRPVRLLQVGMSLRGSGKQGATSRAIEDLFQTIEMSVVEQRDVVLLFFDEADTFVPSRQMMDDSSGGQENLAIVNGIIKGIDHLRASDNCSAAVIFATNAVHRLDSALLRRCIVYEFRPPSHQERLQVLTGALNGFGLTEDEILAIHAELAPRPKGEASEEFSFSDILEGVILGAVDYARFHDKKLSCEIILACARSVRPTIRVHKSPSRADIVR